MNHQMQNPLNDDTSFSESSCVPSSTAILPITSRCTQLDFASQLRLNIIEVRDANDFVSHLELFCPVLALRAFLVHVINAPSLGDTIPTLQETTSDALMQWTKDETMDYIILSG